MKLAALLTLVTGALTAQIPNPTSQQATAPPGTGPMPIFRVTVVSRTTKAVNYHHRNGSTHIDFRGTELMPAARGEARWKARWAPPRSTLPSTTYLRPASSALNT